jgi:hypothetical protein
MLRTISAMIPNNMWREKGLARFYRSINTTLCRRLGWMMKEYLFGRIRF